MNRSPQSDNRYLAGFDFVRVVAISLVTAQHALSLLNLDEWTVYADLSIGQLGVGLFLAMSGYLATVDHRPPVVWLTQRLRRLLPPYWLVLAGSFVLAGIAGHKSFDTTQVAAQFLGIGLFTHGSRIINTPTWFISLLLLCYLGTFIARFIHAQRVMAVGAAAIFAVAVATDSQAWFTVHFLTFSLATALALTPRRSGVTTLLTVVCLTILAAALQPMFAYPALALGATALAQFVPHVSHAIRLAAEYSYEYYLVHGVALFGVIRFLPDRPIAAVVIALGLAMGAAVALRRVTASITRRTNENTPAVPDAEKVANAAELTKA